MPATPLAERFWPKVDRSGGPDACWEWTACRLHGYGIIGIQVDRKTRNLSAHRVSWELANGPIEPSNLCVLHRCDNRPCVNPAHLFLGSDRDNQIDCVEKGRRRTGENHYAAQLSLEDVVAIRHAIADGTARQADLVRRYGVRPELISRIVRGATWKGAPGPITLQNNWRTQQRPRKLSQAQMDAIRSEYVPRRVTQPMLARKYGVPQSMVSCIIRGLYG